MSCEQDGKQGDRQRETHSSRQAKRETNGRQAAAGKVPRFQVGDTWAHGGQVGDKWQTSGRQAGDKSETSGGQVGDKWQTSGRQVRPSGVQVRDKWEADGRQVEDN